MKVKVISILLLLNIIVIFTGCSNIKQLDERMIIHGVGIDKVEDEFELTIQQFSASDSKEKEEGAQVIKTKGNSIMDAFSDLSLKTGKDPLYSQNFLLAIGEDTARKGVNDILDFFIRHYESRPTVKVIVVKGKAEDALGFKRDNKLVMAKDIVSIAESEKFNSKVMSSNIFQFVGDLKNVTSSPNASFISIEKQDDNEVLVANGTAVFKDDKLVGIMNTEDTMGALIINNRIKNGTEVVDIESVGRVSFSLSKSKSKVKFSLDNGNPTYYINIKVNTNIYEIEREMDKQFPNNALELMRQSLEERIKLISYQAINKSIYEYNSDIFGFGKIVLNSNKDYFQSIDGNWDRIIKDAKYNIDVKVKINNTGQGIG